MRKRSKVYFRFRKNLLLNIKNQNSFLNYNLLLTKEIMKKAARSIYKSEYFEALKIAKSLKLLKNSELYNQQRSKSSLCVKGLSLDTTRSFIHVHDNNQFSALGAIEMHQAKYGALLHIKK